MLSTTHLSRQEIIAWYSGPDASSADITTRAYKDAVQYFEKELAKDDRKSLEWIRTNTSMSDVLNVVRQAQNQYSQHSEKTARAQKWISSFASSISYFGSVLEILAQADPLHAGLAWGAMKFILMGVLNHDRMIGDLCKALTKIAGVLPRVQLDNLLYNTTRMSEAVAKLYAHILLFLREAVSWYQHSTIRRSIHSLVRPLLFQDAIADIEECTKEVIDIAAAASRAEMRGLTLMNASLQQQLQGLAQALQRQESANHNQFQSMSSFIEGRLGNMSVQTDQALKQILQIATSNYSLSHSIKTDTTNIQEELFSRHSERILELLAPEVDPEQLLRVCWAVSKRHRSLLHGRDASFISKQAQAWANTSQSCMLVMRTLPRAEARSKDMALQIVRFLKSATSIPVFWHFSYPAKQRTSPDISKILATLVYQALRHDGSLFGKDVTQTGIEALSLTNDLSSWVSVTKQVLARVKQCFIVIEMDDLYRSSGYHTERMNAIHDTLSDIYRSVKSSGGVIKLLVVTRGGVQQFLDGDDHIVVNVDGPMPVASRLKAPRALLFASHSDSRGNSLALKRNT